MCGHVGMFGSSLNDTDAKILYHLLHFDTLRGDDSTGLGIIYDLFKESEASFVLKELGPPDKLYKKFLKSFDWKDLIYTKGLNLVIGHNRKATQGAVNVDNAHPFEFDNLIGAHNGTVSQWSLRNLVGFKEFHLDSKIIYSHLNSCGNIQEIWDVADGAMALVWWDKQIKTLNFARNKERPLYYMLSEDNTKVYWASEDWMIYVSLSRSGVKLTDKTKFVEVKENTQYVFYLDKGEIVVKTLPLSPKKAYVWPETTSHHSGRSSASGNTNNVIALERNITYFHIVDYVITNTTRPSEGYLIGEVSGSKKKVKVFVPANIFENVLNDLIKESTEEQNHIKYRGVNSFPIKGQQEFEWGLMWNNCKRLHIEETPPVKDHEGYAEGYNKKLLTKLDFLTLTSNGCSNCGGNVFWSERGAVYWADSTSPICTDCAPYVQFQGIRHF